MSSFDLAGAVSEFTEEVQNLLDAVLPGEREVRAVQLEDRYVVRPEGAGLEPAPVPLTVDGVTLAWLRVSFRCHVDHQARYLAVDKSQFILASTTHRTPLLRLEFVRDACRAPCAHWQFHAERGAFSALLAHAGVKAPHDLASLHLPVGGARLRPCLEDFLEFLARECRIDRVDGWEQAIREGRERWRRRQVATLVRDAPEVAIRVLEENGYLVEHPQVDGRPGRAEALRQW